MRKSMLFTVIIVGVLSAFLFLLAIDNRDARAADVLTVARYGGTWGDAIDENICRTFEKEYGIKVVVDPGVSTVTLAKLGQQKGNPTIDVAWMDGGISEIALVQGLVDWIDPRKAPNVDKMSPEAVYKTEDGKIFSLGAGFYSLGIVCNMEEVKIKPESWFDLWKKEFKGKSTAPDPANAMGIPFLVTVAKINGGGIGNIEPGLKAMAKLEPAAFFKTSGSATNMFQSGEVIIGAHYSNPAWVMIDKGLPMAYFVPKEGACGGDIRVHIVKGTKHKEWAEKFVNHAVSQSAQKGMAEKLYVGPTNRNVVLSETAKKRMPWGYGGSVANLNLYDWEVLRVNREKWTEEWNKVVVGR